MSPPLNSECKDGCDAAPMPSYEELRTQRDELVNTIKGLLAVIDQPITRRLRKANSIFNADMLVVEHFARDAILKARS